MRIQLAAPEVKLVQIKISGKPKMHHRQVICQPAVVQGGVSNGLTVHISSSRPNCTLARGTQFQIDTSTQEVFDMNRRKMFGYCYVPSAS